MALFTFKLPDIGEGTVEAEIAAWRVGIGDAVEEDQPLVDMMTDKATVELTSPVAGIVQSLAGEAGARIAVGSALVVFATEEGEPAAVSVTTPPPLPKVSAAPPAAPSLEQAARVMASPSIRRKAAELGIQLQLVQGSGPSGRISQSDLDAYLAMQPIAVHGAAAAVVAQAPPAVRSDVEEIAIIGLRRQIAERMQLAKRHIPHFSYVEEVDVSELEDLRAYLNGSRQADQPKLTPLPFIMRALVRVLPDFPQINATYDDEAGVLRRYAAVHMGVATQTPRGLMVAVVRDAQARDLWNTASEVARVAAAARNGSAKREELSGSTITVTSLGALGGIVTTPVINRPEVAIVGPNRILERPVVRGGAITIRRMMNLSSSFDHRIVDGADAAEFIQRIRVLLEHPAALFVP